MVSDDKEIQSPVISKVVHNIPDGLSNVTCLCSVVAAAVFE